MDHAIITPLHRYYNAGITLVSRYSNASNEFNEKCGKIHVPSHAVFFNLLYNFFSAATSFLCNFEPGLSTSRTMCSFNGPLVHKYRYIYIYINVISLDSAIYIYVYIADMF